MMKFRAEAPRHFFFTGKGGVGKTSIACATAVHLARQGKRVLLVSTDPASNVAQVFGATIGNRVTPIEQVPGLATLEINPDEAAEEYRNKILDPSPRHFTGQGDQGDHRTAVWLVHHRDCIVQRVH